MRENFHTMKFTMVKYAVYWVLVSSQRHSAITLCNSRVILVHAWAITPHFFLPAPGNHCSALLTCGFGAGCYLRPLGTLGVSASMSPHAHTSRSFPRAKGGSLFWSFCRTHFWNWNNSEGPGFESHIDIVALSLQIIHEFSLCKTCTAQSGTLRKSSNHDTDPSHFISSLVGVYSKS